MTDISEELLEIKFAHIPDPKPRLQQGDVLKHRADNNRKQCYLILDYKIVYGGLLGKSIEYYLRITEKVGSQITRDEQVWMHEVHLPIDNNVPFEEF